MPIYMHRCGTCGHEFDRIMSIKAQVETVVCPQCGKNTAARVITPVSVIFKGHGFYTTDNRRKNVDQ